MQDATSLCTDDWKLLKYYCLLGYDKERGNNNCQSVLIRYFSGCQTDEHEVLRRLGLLPTTVVIQLTAIKYDHCSSQCGISFPGSICSKLKYILTEETATQLAISESHNVVLGQHVISR